MASVQRKFAAGLVSLFIIPSAHYIGQATRLTPDDSAEPIYEFTQTKTAPTPIPSRTVDTAPDPDRPPPDAGKIRKTLLEKFKQNGINADNVLVAVKKGNDGKPFLQVSVKVSKSTVSASRFKEIVNAAVNKHTAGNYRVESKLVTGSIK
jgi:hypothetical protein